MKKKYFIPLLLLGSVLIFSFLPIANYKADPWRVLHHDDHTSYKGISPNKTFLKLLYLLDNPKKYDTILMGSSRSGYMDSRLISKHSYNMKFNFALAGMHLHNLKILLKHKVQIRDLWLGVNDYIIWKDPHDHESDFQRKTYKDDFWEQLTNYSFYLLKEIQGRDINILTGKYHLSPSEELTNPDQANMKTARAREKYAHKHPSAWIDKMTKIKPTLLGYKDDSYRIDKAIAEIKEIKKLCDTHDIRLTLFMYPSYYKTYLKFNQYKIEEFKRKLTTITGFYDFYDLDNLSLQELSWQDSSHFHASIGDYIIHSIQNNKFLVTKDTIENRIQETRNSIKNIVVKHLPTEYIYQINTHMDLTPLKTIFNLKDTNYKFYKNNQFTLAQDEGFIKFTTKTNDPILILNKTKSKSENVILSYKFESDKNTVFQLFYKKTNESEYNEGNSISIKMIKGSNKFNLLIPSKYLNNALRIDLVNHIGTYKIKDFTIYGID